MILGRNSLLDNDPLHFIQRNGIARSVVEFRRPRRLVGGDRLGVLDRASVLKVRRDPGRPEGVAAEGGREARVPRPARDHLEDFRPLDAVVREPAGPALCRPELCPADAGSARSKR